MTDPEQRSPDQPTSVPNDTTRQRRPGEAAFAVFLVLASLTLLWNAYGISGFHALSGAGAVPMATTAVMVLTAFIVLVRTTARPKTLTQTLSRDIVPGTVIVMTLLLLAYALLLRPLGFLPTSALFLIVAIRVLSRGSWIFTITVALGSLIVIWLIFRIVFTVLMPPGIVPEAEFIQIFRTLLNEGI